MLQNYESEQLDVQQYCVRASTETRVLVNIHSNLQYNLKYAERKAKHFSENKGISYIQLLSKIVILHASIAHLLFGYGWVPLVAHVGEALNSTFALPVLRCFMFVIFTAWSWVQPLGSPDGKGPRQPQLTWQIFNKWFQKLLDWSLLKALPFTPLKHYMTQKKKHQLHSPNLQHAHSICEYIP